MRPTPICSASIYRSAIPWLAVFALLLAASVRADDATPEVITLQYRTAAELLPLLEPFVDKNGVVKAAENKLILRTTPANLADLRKLIAELDKPRRQLLIEVKQLSGESARESGATANKQAKVWRTEPGDDETRLQQVQVIEGGEAFIDVGRQIPISDFAITLDRRGTRIEQNTRYAGATTGFYARPRLIGDGVTLEISPYQVAVQGTATPPAFEVQSLRTTVAGKLGEWILIGASTRDTGQGGRNDLTYSTAQRGEPDRRILVRVTVAKP